MFVSCRDRVLRVDVALKLVVRSQQTQVANFGGQDECPPDVRVAAQKRERHSAEKSQQVPPDGESSLDVLAEAHHNNLVLVLFFGA